VGLALSGGGIRSATFCLGVLQALARKNRLRQIDFLSTVSGGGYIGGFLGRLFTRITTDVADKAGRVQEIVADLNSPQIHWLRSTANYIAGGGLLDLRRNLAYTNTEPTSLKPLAPGPGRLPEEKRQSLRAL
jgi:predicted acylesterase/phospholipase RssA